jgi:Tfx family DNA-binding protein
MKMKLPKKHRTEREILTSRQAEILKLRSQNRTQKEIAQMLGITRQNVSILENRAVRNLKAAEEALSLASRMGISRRIKLKSGIHILTAARRVIEEADSAKIKLNSSAIDIVSLIRTASGRSVRNGIVQVDMHVLIFPDGSLMAREAAGE